MKDFLDLFRGLRPAGWIVLIVAVAAVVSFGALIIYAVSQ